MIMKKGCYQRIHKGHRWQHHCDEYIHKMKLKRIENSNKEYDIFNIKAWLIPLGWLLWVVLSYLFH